MFASASKQGQIIGVVVGSTGMELKYLTPVKPPKLYKV